MSANDIVLSAAGASAPATYVEDVFSTYLYTGNADGASGGQTIVNGIDLATKGGLVWFKKRSSIGNNFAIDTARGAGYVMNPDATYSSSLASQTLTSFNATGYTLGYGADINNSASTYASWAFRKQPKFFDIVTYTGNGDTGVVINHNLGSTPGMMIIKATNSTSNWFVWHKDLNSDRYLFLNTTAEQITNAGHFGIPTSTTFTVGDTAVEGPNKSGKTYVAYLFAHNAGGFGAAGTDNVISCGSFTGNTTVNLGYEPQYIIIKSTSSAGGWYIHDVMRGWHTSGDAAYLYANSYAAESSTSQIYPNATGFSTLIGSDSYIYMAIRRPMKVPTTGTSVYNAIARTGTGSTTAVTGVGFSPDFALVHRRNGAANVTLYDRLRGRNKILYPDLTLAQYTAINYLSSFDMDGVTLGNSTPNTSGQTFINYFFKRSKGFFDIVCYNGTGTAGQTYTHNLGVVPEMMIIKSTSSAYGWAVYIAPLGNNKHLILQETGAAEGGKWNNTTPTETIFSVSGSDSMVNFSGYTYVAYLFASLAGVSKIGSYTGNGSTQTINCGFTGGARFVLIRRTDSAGSWRVFDTARGIVEGDDGCIRISASAAEEFGDDIDPTSSGFIINETNNANINTNSGTYIYLAVA